MCGGDGSTCNDGVDVEMNRNLPEVNSILPVENMHSEQFDDSDFALREERLLTTSGSYFQTSPPDGNVHQQTVNAHNNEAAVNDVKRDVMLVVGRDVSEDQVWSLDDLPEHLWQETPFSPCSATCGTGKKLESRS